MNFNYGEMSLYSVVDPYFDLFAVIGLSPEGAGLEEAYFTTRKLPYGFQVKAGKFLASFGRVNEQHEHFWDFANRPLIATALFGEEGLNEIGAQATWVAPTSFYLVFGAEVLNGENEQSFGTSGFSDPGGSVAINAVQGPNLFIGFIRSSFDIEDASILFGISNAMGTTRTDQGFSSTGGTGEAVNANTDIIGGDLTVKYSLDAIRYLSFQSEYMYRVMNGTEYKRDSSNAVSSLSLDKHHSGFYAQLVAKIDQLWRIGVRYDLLMQNDVTLGGADQHMPSNLPRYSAMIEYSPTEFSRLRLQFDRDESRYVQTSGGWSSAAIYTNYFTSEPDHRRSWRPCILKKIYFSFIYGVSYEIIKNYSAVAVVRANSIHRPAASRDDLRLHQRHRSAHRQGSCRSGRSCAGRL